MNFIEKVKGLLMEPSKTYDALKEESLGEALIYYISLIAIMTGLLFLSMLITDGTRLRFKDIYEILMFAVLLFILVYIYSFIFHFGVCVVGKRKGIDQTTKALVYAQTPSILGFGLWAIGFIILNLGGASENEKAGLIIPIFFSTILWSLALEVIGVRQLQELTTSRAIAATLIFIVIAAVLTRLFSFLLRI